MLLRGKPDCQWGRSGYDEDSMTKEALSDRLHASPFKPFALRLTDGTLLPVPHPDFVSLTRGGRTVIVHKEGEHFSILDLALVTALEVEGVHSD